MGKNEVTKRVIRTIEVVYMAILKIDGVYSCGRCNHKLDINTTKIESGIALTADEKPRDICSCGVCGNKICNIDKRSQPIIDEILGTKLKAVKKDKEVKDDKEIR